MKKNQFFLFLLMSFLISLSGAVCAQSNLLTNPGFASKLTGWRNNDSSTAVSGRNVRTGYYAARVGASSGSLQQSLIKKLVPGRKYRLSFYGKLSSSTASAKVSLRVRNEAGDLLNIQNASVLTTSYTKYTKDFTYGTTANSFHVVVLKSGTSNYIYVDDFSLTELPSSSWTEEFMSLVNNHRASIGLDPLIHNAELAQIVTEHSKNMAAGTLSFGHTGFSERCSDGRIVLGGANWCAENVAKGQTSPQSVFNSWMNSTYHRDNIESPKGTHTGLGYAKSSGGTYYWTLMFLQKT